MPINAVRNYLNGQSHGPNHYADGSIHTNWFNLYERDNNGKNIHPYHFYIRYAPTKGHFSVSVYYEKGDWKVDFDKATKRLPDIKQAILDDSRWAQICSVLGQPTKFAEREEKKDIHGHFKFQFDYNNDNLPPTQAQLDVIKKLVDLLFEKFL